MSAARSARPISPKWRDFRQSFSLDPPSPGVETERAMSEANVEIIRRHYERDAEAFRGGDVRAFLEIAGPDMSLRAASTGRGRKNRSQPGSP